MKGILHYDEVTRKWMMEYDEDNRIMLIDVAPGRINDLKLVGSELKDKDIVDFIFEDTQEFPYRWAVPVIIDEGEPLPEPEPKKVMVKKKRVHLWLAGFHETSTRIDCEEYDNSSDGYWYFYDRDKNRNRIYVGVYPISRTIIRHVQDIEVEVALK